MAEVLPFIAPEPNDPHLGGEGICTGCKHTWVAVAPVGTWQLECPSCGAWKGVWRYPVGAEVGDHVFTCNCGCQALTAYYHEKHFHLKCMSCGTEQTAAIFGD